MFTWIDGNSNVGADNVASRACRMATNDGSVTPPRRWTLLSRCSRTVVSQA
jgi:hypothetical protein